MIGSGRGGLDNKKLKCNTLRDFLAFPKKIFLGTVEIGYNDIAYNDQPLTATKSPRFVWFSYNHFDYNDRISPFLRMSL